MTEFDLDSFLAIDGAAESIEESGLVNIAKKSLERGKPELDFQTDREKEMYEEGLNRGITQGVGWALITVDHCLSEKVFNLADYEGFIYGFETGLNECIGKDE